MHHIDNLIRSATGRATLEEAEDDAGQRAEATSDYTADWFSAIDELNAERDALDEGPDFDDMIRSAAQARIVRPRAPDRLAVVVRTNPALLEFGIRTLLATATGRERPDPFNDPYR